MLTGKSGDKVGAQIRMEYIVLNHYGYVEGVMEVTIWLQVTFV